jgi:ribosomal protein S18 acetylase RimI-like enzyme
MKELHEALTDTVIRPAIAADAARLNAALAQLSADLGDAHTATQDDILRAGWGPDPMFRACLAERDHKVVGLVMFTPYFSTVRGAGVMVSDLWISAGLRGAGLGPRLLAAALAQAGPVWGARWLKLSVYHTNADAARFYTKLGFVPAQGQTEMLLDEAGCRALKGLE